MSFDPRDSHNAEDRSLPDLLGDRYRIVRELGHGGMARVYLATDIKHNRQVAVKVIRPDLAASLGRERFLREIAIAARLRHPNIVPLYDSGDVDGVLYFVMPYEEGESLRQRLATRQVLQPPEYISILRDVARALAYAHSHGVVHRDVKPDNVMLSGDAAVVTDFGIAKALSTARGDSAQDTTLTRAGDGIGTPTYMAPEQAVGDPATDHRADIYAFGCLAYELVTGKPPFHDMPHHQLVAAHVSVEPIPLATAQRNVPANVATLVMRCLAKEPADRPQSAQDLAAALDSVTLSPTAFARPKLAGGAGLAAVFRPRPVAALMIGIALVAAAWIARHRPPPLPQELTVAVLPMFSIGGDSLQRDLANGLSDEVAFELYRVPGVVVMSKKALASFHITREINPVTLGRTLGARYLVMGTYREHGRRLQVIAKLLDATTGSILWDAEFERDVREYGDIRSAIALAVGGTLRRLLAPDVAAQAMRGRAPRAVNPEAFRLYRLAQSALDKRGLNVRSSVDNFSGAVAIDSTYAEAWAGLSLARVLTPFFNDVPSRSIAGAVRDAATRALRLDSTLAAPHVALGLMHYEAYRWDSAETELKIGVRLRAPADVEPLVQYGRYLGTRGRIHEELQQFLLARQTEPASALVSAWTAIAFLDNGFPDSALVEITRAEQNDSTNFVTILFGMGIRMRLGQRAEARRLAARLPLSPNALYVFAATGDTALVGAWLRKDDSTVPKAWMAWTRRANVLLGMGDTTAAIAAFEHAAHANELPWWPGDERKNSPLWRYERYRRLMQRVGLGDVVLPTDSTRRSLIR